MMSNSQVVQVRPEDVFSRIHLSLSSGQLSSSPTYWPTFNRRPHAHDYWRPAENFPNVIMTFALELDEEGEYVYSDTAGFTYGTGSNFELAVLDWRDSAKSVLRMLSTEGHSFHESLSKRRSVLLTVLNDSESRGELESR